MLPTVVNIKDPNKPTSGKTVYIGRPKGNEAYHFGNPFSHLNFSKAVVHVANVQESVNRCRSWLKGETDQQLEPARREWIIKNIRTLKTADYLACFCKPGPCHGDVLVELLQKELEKEGPIATATPAPPTPTKSAPLPETKQEVVRIAVIGTAGRKDDHDKLYPEMYTTMCARVLAIVQEVAANHEGRKVVLSSGGAAWADHCAVTLFNKGQVDGLELELPARYDTVAKAFQDIKGPDGKSVRDFNANPGGTANYYHQLFSRRLQRDTLAEIGTAIDKGAKVTITPGFKNRNSEVAKADALVALTFGDGQFLKDGGTADTTKKYLERIESQGKEDYSYHVDLKTFKIHVGAQVLDDSQKQSNFRFR